MTTWPRRFSTVVADDQLLYTVGADYVDCLRSSGALPVLLPVVTPPEAETALDGVHGLVVSGGNDVTPALYGQTVTHARDAQVDWDISDIALVRAARNRGLPTLGICRGAQVMNVAFGGTLHQEVTGATEAHPVRPANRREALAYRHPVRLVAGSWLAEAYGTTRRVVTSLHHQGIDALAGVFTAVASAEDGLIEAIQSEDPDWYAIGVQWHPEKMAGQDAPLFDAFVHAVRGAARDTTGGRQRTPA